MAQYGDDKALSMGGALPGAVVNGLVDEYPQLVKTGRPVYTVTVFGVNYVKHYPNGDKPDEPVLEVLRVEVAHGQDEAVLLAMIDRLQSERNDDNPKTLATSQGELTS